MNESCPFLIGYADPPSSKSSAPPSSKYSKSLDEENNHEDNDFVDNSLWIQSKSCTTGEPCLWVNSSCLTENEKFRCYNGECIESHLVRNGDKDCSDGSDEYGTENKV